MFSLIYPAEIAIAMIDDDVTVEMFNTYRGMLNTDKHNEAVAFFKRYRLRTNKAKTLDLVAQLIS